MKVNAGLNHPSGSEELTPEQEAAVKAAATWVQLFARTLKTCRLYEAGNPTVVRFRHEVWAALQQLLDEHGTIALSFTTDDVLCDQVSLYRARSRDDNLAFPFFRDGVRTVTFSPGVEPREVEALVDALVQVTGQNVEQDDLVTLLWQAHLPHIELEYVPGETDVAADGEQGVPWPTAGEDDQAQAPENSVLDVEPGEREPAVRSDDWKVGEFTAEIEAGYEELKALAPIDVHRFQVDYENERRRSPVETAVTLVRAYMSAGADREDLLEIARFLPRVLRQALVQGSWLEAAEALGLLERCESAEWSIVTFAQELLQPISVSSIKERLEHQDAGAVASFVQFSMRLGEPAVDLLNLVLAEIENPRHQRLLTEAIVELCRSNPERLAPALADPRWFVVRNIVQVLGAIGGNSIVGLLGAVVQHPEPRVRHEVLGALRQVEPRLSRPLLLRMIEGADTRMFCAVLHLLSQERDPDVAELLLGHLLAESFDERPVEEKRAIYSALSASGADDVLPALEAELYKGSWFSRSPEAHRQAVARCVARIGTPVAREVLERGARTWRAPVRKACEDALVRFGKND